MTYFRKQKGGKLIEMEYLCDKYSNITSKQSNMVKKVWQWIVWSSANPEVVSLTIKGFVPFLLLLGIKETDTGLLADSFNQLLLSFSMFVSAFFGFYGLLRKVINTLK